MPDDNFDFHKILKESIRMREEESRWQKIKKALAKQRDKTKGNIDKFITPPGGEDLSFWQKIGTPWDPKTGKKMPYRGFRNFTHEIREIQEKSGCNLSTFMKQWAAGKDPKKIKCELDDTTPVEEPAAPEGPAEDPPDCEVDEFPDEEDTEEIFDDSHPACDHFNRLRLSLGRDHTTQELDEFEEAAEAAFREMEEYYEGLNLSEEDKEKYRQHREDFIEEVRDFVTNQRAQKDKSYDAAGIDPSSARDLNEERYNLLLRKFNINEN